MVSFGQHEFRFAIREALEGAWTKDSDGKGLKMQVLVHFKRASPWKYFADHDSERPKSPGENNVHNP